MIVFKSVIWQNFLSTGNTPIEIVEEIPDLGRKDC